MGMNSSSQQGSGYNQYSSTPINLQNPAYTGIAGGVAQQLVGALQGNPYGIGTGGGILSPYAGSGGSYYSPGTNPLVAPVTGGQQTYLDQIAGVTNPGAGTLNNQAATTAWNATNYANSNPLQSAFNQNQNAANTANNAFGGAYSTLNNAANVARNNFTGANNSANQAASFASGGGYGGQGAMGFGPAFQQAYNYLNPNYPASLATSPQTQAAVQAAVNPLIQSFNAQTVPGLQGTFTAAGQRLGNANAGLGGSSAFDIAGANALTGLGANIGATAQGIVNPAYQTGLQLQGNAINQIGQLGSALESGLQGAATTQGNITAQQAAAETAAGTAQGNVAAEQSAAQNNAALGAGSLVAENIANMINSATGAQGIVTQQVNNLINGLNAQALPQLTQQYGINQGLQLYNTQVNQLLTALGLGGQVSQPAIAYNSMGGGTSQNSGSSKGFSGPSVSIPFTSSARYKTDIRELNGAEADAVLKLRPVAFEYNQTPGQRHGFIAEEVAEVLPEMVVHGPDGRVEGLDYAHMPALVVAALQKQQATIERLEARVAELETR